MSLPKKRGHGTVVVCRALLGLAVLSCLACRSVPTTHYYVLTESPGSARAATTPSTDGVLLGIQDFEVDPPYDQNRLVYRLGDSSPEVHFYDYHRWAAPLDRLVPVALARGLADLPGARRVEPVAANGRYDRLLAGRILSFEEIDFPDRLLARIRLDLKLLGPDHELLWSDVVQAEISGHAEDAGDVVDLLRQALDQLAADLTARLAPWMPSDGSSPTTP